MSDRLPPNDRRRKSDPAEMLPDQKQTGFRRRKSGLANVIKQTAEKQTGYRRRKSDLPDVKQTGYRRRKSGLSQKAATYDAETKRKMMEELYNLSSDEDSSTDDDSSSASEDAPPPKNNPSLRQRPTLELKNVVKRENRPPPSFTRTTPEGFQSTLKFDDLQISHGGRSFSIHKDEWTRPVTPVTPVTPLCYKMGSQILGFMPSNPFEIVEICRHVMSFLNIFDVVNVLRVNKGFKWAGESNLKRRKRVDLRDYVNLEPTIFCELMVHLGTLCPRLEDAIFDCVLLQHLEGPTHIFALFYLSECPRLRRIRLLTMKWEEFKRAVCCVYRVNPHCYISRWESLAIQDAAIPQSLTVFKGLNSSLRGLRELEVGSGTDFAIFSARYFLQDLAVLSFTDHITTTFAFMRIVNRSWLTRHVLSPGGSPGCDLRDVLKTPTSPLPSPGVLPSLPNSPRSQLVVYSPSFMRKETGEVFAGKSQAGAVEIFKRFAAAIGTIIQPHSYSIPLL